MSSRILIVAEHDGRALNSATSRILSCAAGFPDAHVTIAVFASAANRDALAAQAAALQGAGEVLCLVSADHEHPTAAALAPQIAGLAPKFTHLLGPSSTFGKDLMPRVAALLGVAQVSDILAVLSPTRFRRPIYAGNAIATVEVLSQPVVATVRLSAFDEAAPAGTPAPIVTAEADVAETGTRFVSLSGAQGDRPDLQSARRVIAGGRGMGSEAGFRRLERLADLTGAAIGATRAAVDAGYAPNELQIGQTGKVIAPTLYIACGISGAIQHLAGIKDAGTVVAINRDSEAPIFEFADLGLVADLDTALLELEALLEAAARTR